MPTSFTSPTNGQTADASHVTQFVAPINNLESGAALYAESAGSATVYTATLAPVPALVAGLTIRLKIDETNSGAATLNVNGTGAVDIRYDNGSAYNTALPASFLKAGGVYQFTYNGTFWLVTGGAAAGSSSVATLDDVGDVDVTGAANGTVLMKTASGWEDRNLAIADINSLQTALDGKSATSHTHSLDNLSDVTITTPATGNLIRYNGSAFVNESLSADEISAALEAGSGTASQVVRGDGTISVLAASDIPSTLNATTVDGTQLTGSNVQRLNDTGQVNICGGSGAAQSNGAIGIFYGNSRSGAEGWASYYCGSASGAKHSFFDKDVVERFRINETGSHADSLGVDFIYANAGGNLNINCGWATPNNHINIFAYPSNDPSNASGLSLCGKGHATYPGAHQQFAPLSTRAASTAIALCPVATGDTAKVEISETTIDDCLVFVNAAGTVSLYDKIGGTVNANIVNSSSPSAAQYGVYISAGVLYFKGGSSYAGKMGSFSKIWKA